MVEAFDDTPRGRDLWHHTKVTRQYHPTNMAAFADFNYFPVVWKQHKDIIFTSNPSSYNWFHGLVGSQMMWNEQEHVRQRKFIENDAHNLVQTDASCAKRRAGAPLRLKSYAQLQDFVGRLPVVCAYKFPDSTLRMAAEDMEKHLRDNKRAWAEDSNWLRLKLGEIPFWLKTIEHREFNLDFLQSDFTGNDSDFDTIKAAMHHVHSIHMVCGVGQIYSKDQMPASLRPPEQQDQERHPPTRGAPFEPPPARREQGQIGRGSDQEDGWQQHNSGSVANPNCHPKFRVFWASVAEAKRHIKLGTVFRNAQATTPGAMHTLCGDTRACGPFILKGSCVRDCPHLHDPHCMLEDVNCNMMIETLSRGLDCC